MLALLLVAAACDSGFVEVFQARIDADSPTLLVPTVVSESVPFTVVIPIRVCPGNEAAARVRVGQSVEIEPYIIEHPGYECLLAEEFPLEVEVTWPHPGPFALFIVGRDLDGDPLVLGFEVDGL